MERFEETEIQLQRAPLIPKDKLKALVHAIDENDNEGTVELISRFRKKNNYTIKPEGVLISLSCKFQDHNLNKFDNRQE